MSDDGDTPETLKDLGQMFETAMKYPDLPDNLYEVFSLLSSTFLEYKEAAGESGWAANVRKVDGSPAFTDKEAKSLESALTDHKEQLGSLMRG